MFAWLASPLDNGSSVPGVKGGGLGSVENKPTVDTRSQLLFLGKFKNVILRTEEMWDMKFDKTFHSLKGLSEI